MPTRDPALPSRPEWTLIRNARQLLTLQGPSGARRGPAMSALGVIPGASILIRNGLIEEIGAARRVENLAGARHALEIDAAGKIVLPAFVDAATNLVPHENPALRTMSKRVVQARAETASFQCARQGCLTIGARTPAVADLRGVTKVLRTHQACQSRPLRIRSILFIRIPPVETAADPANSPAAYLAKCLPLVHDRKLATIIEFDLDGSDTIPAVLAGAGMGFALRFRSRSAPSPAVLRLAIEAGAISLVAPACSGSAAVTLSSALASAGCVHILPACEVLEPSPTSPADVRRAISAGDALALASDGPAGNPSALLAPAVQRLGLTIEEAITAITWNPACALRLAQSAGSLETGKSADLVLLDLPDYRDLALAGPPVPISLVMRAGHTLFAPPH